MNAQLNRIALRRWFASCVVAIDLNVRFRAALMSAQDRAGTVGDHAYCGQEQPSAGCAGRSVRRRPPARYRERLVAN